MEARASTEYIVIHCSATKPSMDVDAETIRNWHTLQQVCLFLQKNFFILKSIPELGYLNGIPILGYYKNCD